MCILSIKYLGSDRVKVEFGVISDKKLEGSVAEREERSTQEVSV